MFIFDASTLILIAKTETLDFFLSGVELDVAIPLEVEKECCGVKKSLDALMIQKTLDESRIIVIAVKDRKLVTGGLWPRQWRSGSNRASSRGKSSDCGNR